MAPNDTVPQIIVRYVIAIGCVAGSAWLHYSGTLDVGLGLVLWFVLAAGAGFLVPHFWMLLVAPIPWITGIGIGVWLDQYDGLGNNWYVVWALSSMAGVIGITLGAGLRRSKVRARR